MGKFFSLIRNLEFIFKERSEEELLHLSLSKLKFYDIQYENYFHFIRYSDLYVIITLIDRQFYAPYTRAFRSEERRVERV